MTFFEQLVTTGRIVDLILVLILVEILAILIFRRLTGGGIAALPLLTNVGAGGSLVLALRAALTGAGWSWVAAFLVVGLVFHVLDLALRWHRPVPAGQNKGGRA